MTEGKKRLDWIAIEGAYRAGVLSLRAIGEQFGCTEGAIRKQAKRMGWFQDPEGRKREQVKSIMAGIMPGTQDGTRYAQGVLSREAQIDADDMGDCLAVARKGLRKLFSALDGVDEPKDIKIVLEANKIAMETIRRIRGLDDPAPPNPDDRVLKVSIHRLTA